MGRLPGGANGTLLVGRLNAQGGMPWRGRNLTQIRADGAFFLRHVGSAHAARSDRLQPFCVERSHMRSGKLH